MSEGPFAVMSSADLDRLAFEKLDGLVPVVTQDARTGEALMVAFADREALERTLETGEMHYRSRSRDELWRKGATSGNVQRVVSLHADCDADTVLARVEAAGPACHTGARSCFGTEAGPPLRVLAELARIVDARAAERPEGSYTTRLLDDETLRLKKLGEETAELVVELVRAGDGAPTGRAPGEAEDEAAAPRATEARARATEEAADLLYHLVVALRGGGISLEEVLAVLEGRRTEVEAPST